MAAADSSASDSHRHLSVTSPPPPISKDVLGSINPIPLSPQWLLPKPGENKTGLGIGENHWNKNSNNGSGSDTTKLQGFGEESHNIQKNDVFRPSMLDMETGNRRDRWRDEERDTNSSIRKDRGIDGGNDFGDTRKIDRWTENVSSRQFGEGRRVTSERRTDSSNREVNYEQRRESKWNTSWGPDEKEKESLREKWVDTVRDRDMPSEKGVSHLNTPGKDETGGDHYRPWRSNASQSRGRGEPSQHQTLTSNKHGPMFSYGRGRGENSPSTFSLGRGRVHSSGSPGNNFSSQTQSFGTKSEKSEILYGDPSLLRYSRTKLLDVYRTIDMRSSLEVLGGFIQVASLTREEPLEPVTLSAPTPGELVILKGIEKGDIVSSDAPQISKEGSVGRNTIDFFQSRGSKPGSKEDFADHFNEEGVENSKRGSSSNPDSSLSEGGYQIHPDNQFNTEVLREERNPYRKAYEVPAKRESSMEDTSSAPVSTPWRSTSIAERSHDVQSSTSEMSWSQPQKYSNERQGNVASLSHPKNDMKWHLGEDPVIKKLPPGIPFKDHESLKVVPPPEDLVLFYKDPQGEIQGPFSGIDVIGWFEAGYFGIDLQVRLASEQNNSPFSSLGDVMPHLRAKSGPPPGFSSPKQNEIADAPRRPSFGSFGSFGRLHGGSNNVDVMNSEPMHLHGSAKEAENRFLESLMSANISSPPLEKLGFSQGLQGYIGNNSIGVPPVGLESEDSVYLMAKKELERQKSLFSHYPNQPQLPNVSNNIVTSWSNFPIQVGMESFQDKVGLYHGQSSPLPPAFGIQQQLLQQQNQSSLTSLLAQTMDNASGLPQDPQLLNMLQQQYLLQLHSQTAGPTQQLSVLDKLLLLKQQHQQEQQQKLMLQQQLLSQVLSEQHAAQRLGDPSYGPATAISAGNATVGGMPPSQEFFQDGSDLPVTNRQDQRNIDYHNLSPQVSQDVNLGFETTLHLPHQMFGNEPSKQSSGTVVTDKTIINQHPEQLLLPSNDGVKSLEVMDQSSQVPSIMHKGSPTSDYSSLALNETFKKPSKINDPSIAWETEATFKSVPQLTTDVKVKLDGSFEEKHDGMSRAIDEPSLTTSLENVEVHEVRRASDKKSRKQKASKAKDVSKMPSQQDKSFKIEDTNVDNSVFETQFGIGKAFYGSSPQNATDTNFETRAVETLDSQSAKISLSASFTGDDEFLNIKAISSVTESVPQQEKQSQTVQRAWKPAPGFKAKSLLEIQQEEQRKAQMETVVYENTSSSNPMNLSAPWTGVMSRADGKSSTGVPQDAEVTDLVWGMSNSSLNSVSKKSQLHNLLAEEVLAKSKEKDLEVDDKTFGLSLQPAAVTHLDSIDNENFIEAKDSKKNRKKSAKAKVATKAPVTVDLSLGTSPVDTGKSTRHGQQEKEVLPAVPSGPSLGDFVLWKGSESPNSVPAPAWSNDSGKLPKPTSLRDILKEQGKKVSSAQHQSQTTPQKSQPVQTTRGNGTFSLHGSSPSKAASPIQINSHASAHLKFKEDDDPFWGASDQPKQVAKQMDFPQLAQQSSRGTKNTPVKGTPGRSSSQQKSVSGRPTEPSLSSSPTTAQSSLKGKRDTMTKHSEAMDFRDWCASETVRLTGTKDTSFLEFCLKQSRSEAEILLRENLGLFDPEHEFIDKFLNYKELLSADVLEIAFQNQMDRTGTGTHVGDVTSDSTVSVEDLYRYTKTGTSASTKDGGKKKGKKGKKVSPSVLGFNVVSNRIMMGEIQTLDD